MAQLTVITNAINIAAELAGTHIEVILTGGMLRKNSFSLVGPLAERTLRQLSADILFFGVDGFDTKAGLFTPNLLESEVNRAMVRIARRTIAVCDSSKFGRRSLCNIMPVEMVHEVITDRQIPEIRFLRAERGGRKSHVSLSGVRHPMKSAEVTAQGQHTLSEIFLSAAVLERQCLAKLAASAEFRAAVQMARPAAEWIFVGCGTSYYLAQAAASTFNYLKLTARAVPASDLLLYPGQTLHAGRDYIPVVISRSGRTSEAIRAAQMLEESTNLRTMAITCADGQPLETSCSITLKLLDADEQSTVMTRSFTSMLLGIAISRCNCLPQQCLPQRTDRAATTGRACSTARCGASCSCLRIRAVFQISFSWRRDHYSALPRSAC